ncbi:hypothetical protein RJ640_012600 [Escallonia rubra]|uniref:Uncharacterized protein n=1 Tax=Escallonia rubra TaxID=112253 RepID=A0AA88RER6_9ASTE|nr:hypothetical protein RJ640_012600 [Escallonia rubra]
MNDQDDEKTALHIAACQGKIEIMKVLISRCPDCWEMVNDRGQNILHISVQNEQKEAIKYIIGHPWLDNLINQKDCDGNTPLHLLATTSCYVPDLITYRSANKLAYNHGNLTTLDIACSDKYIEVLILKGLPLPNLLNNAIAGFH